MSGEQKSNSNNSDLNVRMANIQKLLDEYEHTIVGLPLLNNPCNDTEVELYTSMSRDQLEKLSREECLHIAYKLAQFALFVQRQYNREKSRVSWAQKQLNDAVAKQYYQFDKVYNHEIRVSMVTQQDQYAQKLSDIIIYAKQRMNRLEYTASAIKHMSDIMLANQWRKNNE